MTRIGPEIVFAVSCSLALGAVGGAPLAGQEASQAPVDREDLALVGAAIDALAAGDSRAATDSLEKVPRGDSGLARALVHLLEAQRVYEKHMPQEQRASHHALPYLKKAAEAADGAPKDDFLAALAKIRRSLAETRTKPQPRLRTLLCHVQLLSGEGRVSRAENPRPFGPDMEPPQRAFFLIPEMTELARRARRTGVVITQVLIDQEGCIAGIAILKKQPYGLDEATVRAQWWAAFEPAMADGEPVAVFWNLSTVFNLQ